MHRSMLTVLLGDRVQWFRAEAEYKTWLDQWEITQADCLRFLKAMDYMSSSWDEIAGGKEMELGFLASARKRADVYKKRGETLRFFMKEDGYGHLLDEAVRPQEELFYEHVLRERKDLSGALKRIRESRGDKVMKDEREEEDTHIVVDVLPSM